MQNANTPVEDLLRQVSKLPENWHGAGTVLERGLRALARHARAIQPIRLSVETGTGRSTLLLSHLSEAHMVFAFDDTGISDSYRNVAASPLLNAENVKFVVGPSQRTLLSYEFESPIDLAFLDGPHAYPFPELEYWAVYPHIRPGGLLIVDDIQIPSIRNMYRLLAADAMWSRLEVVDQMAFLARTDAPMIDPYGEGWWLQGFNQTGISPLDRLRQKLAIRTRLRRHLAGRAR